MLRVYASKNAGQAKSYFSKELTRGDYYFGEQEIVGQWGGKAAEQLGLSGSVTQEAFNQLIDNQDPATGEQLTPRQKENRRPGYDLTFSAPKAFSLIYEYSQDERLLDAFRSAVRHTMEDIEENIHTRVRKNGLNEDRQTGNLIYAEFVHFSARPVESWAPDPQLHAHIYVPNVTYFHEEERWKAIQMAPVKTDAPYFEALFHSRLSKSLSDMGLNIAKDGKFWTIDGIEKETLRKFSNRTEEIEQYAKDNNIVSDKAKDQLGARLRGDKVGGLYREQLREQWWDRLDEKERNTLEELSRFSPSIRSEQQELSTAARSVTFAVNHSLERQSVIPLTRLKEAALREGFGATSDTLIETAFADRDDIIVRHHMGREVATTKAVLQEESDIITFTAKGYGTQDKLNPDYTVGSITDHNTGKSFELAQEQQHAIHTTLNSRDRVQAIEGKAGVGKTTALAALIKGIEAGGNHAVILAPTSEAVKTLKHDGQAYLSTPMQNSYTNARYFVDGNLWEQSRGSTLVVDEAGLLSVNDMHNLFALANSFDNRVILVGDTSQHNSVMRGDAFRILQQEAGLEPLSLNTIRRQQNEEYRAAIKAVASGNIAKGFDLLDKQGAVIEETNDEIRYQTLAQKYTNVLTAGETALTVAPTHAEGQRVTHAIREQLRGAGRLYGDDKPVTKYTNLQWTEAEKTRAYNFEPGQLIRFQQNAKGIGESIRRGQQFIVSHTDKESVWVTDQQGAEHQLNLNQPKRFNVYEQQDMSVSIGESIRITEGGKSKDGKQLNNGSIHRIKNIEKNGDIVLGNGQILDSAKGAIDYGYVTTSYSSQGKTVDHVFIAQSTDYGGAASSEQFYVSASRGKQSVEIFTDNKAELRDQIQHSHQRLSATELTKNSTASFKDRMRNVSTLINALQVYATRTMDHLKGTTEDWLRPFRKTNTTSDFGPTRELQQMDRGIER
ncbi:MobF family relaxase [Sessilibacter corallicola]|uniref:TrwC relaxase domain-containing protein n=1 Tax=Sessilibacter corallicola TaxID=2904075 RepID=A0ABQ0A9M1_9GAMM